MTNQGLLCSAAYEYYNYLYKELFGFMSAFVKPSRNAAECCTNGLLRIDSLKCWLCFFFRDTVAALIQIHIDVADIKVEKVGKGTKKMGGFKKH